MNEYHFERLLTYLTVSSNMRVRYSNVLSLATYFSAELLEYNDLRFLGRKCLRKWRESRFNSARHVQLRTDFQQLLKELDVGTRSIER